MSITEPNGMGSEAFSRNRLHHNHFPFPDELDRPGALIRVGRHAGGAYVAFTCGERFASKDQDSHWIEVNIFSDELFIRIKERYHRGEFDDSERYRRDIRRDWSERGEISFPYPQDALDYDIIEAATKALGPEIRTAIDGLVAAGKINPDIRDTIFMILDQAAIISQPARVLE